MEDVRHVFNIIERNSNNIPEGDYIELCNKLKNVYANTLSQATPTLFDMNEYQVQPTNVDELYTVLTAFANDDPNGNDLKDEIPFFDNYQNN